MPPPTRKRTPNSNTFIFDQNNARKINAMRRIKELDFDIKNLKHKMDNYDEKIQSLKKKRGISVSNPNHGMDMAVVLKTSSAKKDKEKCASRIRKKKESIASLKKSLSQSKDLRGGTKTRKTKKKSTK